MKRIAYVVVRRAEDGSREYLQDWCSTFNQNSFGGCRWTREKAKRHRWKAGEWVPPLPCVNFLAEEGAWLVALIPKSGPPAPTKKPPTAEQIRFGRDFANIVMGIDPED